MPTIDLGKIKPQYEGTYSGATAYEPLDFVVVSGSLFVCKLATTGNAPPSPGSNNTWWDSVAPAVDASAVAGIIHAATSKATPVDADEVGLVDSAASFGLKRLTWANIKATLKAYFDTLYPAGIGASTALVKGNGSNGFSAATAGTDYVAPSGALGTPSSGNLSNTTADGTNKVGTQNILQNSQSAAYTLVLSDAGKTIFHPSADTTARTWTIPANSSVAFPVGTVICFDNQNGAGTITIAITTDTMRLAGAGTTGSRTLAANGIATAVKETSTEWKINGTGLT